MDDLLIAAAQELQRNYQWQHQQKRWLHKLKLKIETSSEINLKLLAQSFSDRIGYQQESGRYRLNSGISVDSPSRLVSQWALFPIVNSSAKGHTGIGIPLMLTPGEQRSLSQQTTQL